MLCGRFEPIWNKLKTDYIHQQMLKPHPSLYLSFPKRIQIGEYDLMASSQRKQRQSQNEKY